MCDMEEVKVFTSSKLFFIWCLVWSQIFGSQAIASYYQMDWWKQNSIKKHERQTDKTCFLFQWKLRWSTVCIFFSLTVQYYMMPGRVQVTVFICQIREAIRNWEVQIFFICTVSMKGNNSSMCIFSLEIRYMVVFWKYFYLIP